MKVNPKSINGSGTLKARFGLLLATMAGVASLLSISSNLWADPGFINAADPDLPAKAQGIPRGGALSISNFALEGGETVTLELVRFSVFSADAELTVVTANGSTTMSPPETAYFRGWSNNDPESIVVLAVSEQGSVRGLITGAKGSSWQIESHPGKAIGLQNRKVDLESELAGKTFSCGATDTTPLSASADTVAGAGAGEASGLATNVTRTAHMIVDTDYEYWAVFQNANDAFQYMGDLFAFASSVYEREIDTNLMIDHARLFADNSDPYTATTTGCSGFGTLDEVQAEWQPDPRPRTLTHLLSGKPGGGCAYFAGLCNSGGNGYGTSMGIGDGAGNGGSFDIDNPVIFWDTMVVAHEIGHNFNSPHSHDYCGIAGIADPIDQAVDDGNNNQCSTGDVTNDLPGLGSLTGGATADSPCTLMSYCHQFAGGYGNFSYTFGKWLPYGVAAWREADRMYAHATANESCMTLDYDGPDLAVFKDCKPDDPALVGDTAICTIVVENRGPTMALGVVTEDLFLSSGSFNFGAITATKGDFVMPADTCTSSSSNPQVQSGQVTCDLGELGNGHSVTISIPVTAESPQNVNDRVSVVSDSPDPDMTNNMAEDSLTFYEDADLEVQKICKPDGDAIAGEDTGICEIYITNHGPSIAKNAKLVDEIVSISPYHIDNIVNDDATASCWTVSGDVECDLDDMNPGEVIKVTVTVSSAVANDINDLATATSDTVDSDTSNNSATGQIHFIMPTADLVVTKQCVPETPAPAGSVAHCEIFVYNNGPSVAMNVVLDDQIASNGDYLISGHTTSVGTCTGGGGTNTDLVCDLGNIASGDTETIVVYFISNDDVDIDDIATATSDTDDPNPNNNTASGSVTFYGVADLQITKMDVFDPVSAGTELSYRLRVSNDGPSDAVNVVVSDLVPAGTVVTSAVVEIGTGQCVIGVAGDPARPTQCGLGGIPNGGFKDVRITTFVLPTSRGVLHNDATVSSDYFDDDNSNNQVTEDTTIVVVTSLELSKRADHDPVIAGTELRYVITLSNGGPSTATGVMLTDTLPPEATWLKTKVLGGVGDCLLSQSNPDIVTCTLNNMDPGEMFTVVITVMIDPSIPDGTVISNWAFSTSDDGDNDDAHVDTTVNAEADLWIDKTGGFITQNPGKDIRYTLTVHNDEGCSGDDPQVCGDGGPSDALNVVVIDQLPATAKKLVVTFVSEDCLYDYDTHTVTCVTPILAAGDTVFHEIEATPRGRLRAITNVVDVTSDTTDPDSGNNHDEMLLIVGGGGQKGTGE